MTIMTLISGAIVMGYLIAGLFFIRFWRQTRDRLFVFFAIAFFTLAAQRFALTITADTENQLPIYGLRLVAYLVFLIAIVDRNRRRNTGH
jgi:hypothetical protein